MRKLRSTSGVVAGLVLAAGSLTRATDLPAPSLPIDQVVDQLIDAQLNAEHVTAAPPADDATFIRRLTLDLVGRIPTVAETTAYVASTDPNKRVQLVDRLMASPGFVRHQATELDVMLMYGTRGTVRDYLVKAVAENRPWDQTYRDLLLPNETDAKQKGAGEFIRQRVKDVDQLVTDVGVSFFGVNISCAKCHDHPRVSDWKQDHFYGMKAFFNRTFDNGGFLAEREFGLVKFKTTAGQERQAKLMFLTGKVVDDPAMKEPSKEEEKKEKERLDSFKKNKTPPPPPAFSARAKLVELSLQPGQRDYFSRSIVNRLWHRFFGLGLVMPLDQMHSANPPNHPELLHWLARDVEEHHYDLRRLIRGLVLSRAYARSSRWETGDVPPAELFAVASVRPLTPMQLATSLRLATTDPASFANSKADDLERRLEALENNARGFANSIQQPGENFQIGVSEALLFSNNDQMSKDFLADGGDRLMGRLKQIKDRRELIDLAVRSVLARPPSDEEVKLFEAYLGQREDRPVEACRQLVWALLTSSEFRFNY
jgi:hypothetical protein